MIDFVLFSSIDCVFYQQNLIKNLTLNFVILIIAYILKQKPKQMQASIFFSIFLL